MNRLTTSIVAAMCFAASLFGASTAEAKSEHRWVEENSLIYGYGGLSYGVNLGLNLHGRLNTNPWGPIVGSVKARAGKASSVDGLIGFALSSKVAGGTDSERTGIVKETRTTVTYRVRHTRVVERSQFVLFAGAKAPFHWQNEEFQSSKPSGVLGLHWLNFNSLGNMKVAEINLFVGAATGRNNDTIGDRLGGSLTYLNSIPSIPGFMFGLEVGIIPHSVVYASLDLAYAFGS